MPITRLLVLPALCSLIPSPVAAQRQAERWPFGTSLGEAGPLQRRDLLNLGLMGLKCWDADRPVPDPNDANRRRIASRDRRRRAFDPVRLRVEAVLAGGPADRAGVRIGDIIVGINGQPFRAGSREALTKALVRAEAETGRVQLQLVRGRQRLERRLRIKKRGATAARPEQGKQARWILDQALAFLVSRQQGDGGYPATLCGKNGQVVQTSLAGLAFLAAGSSPRRGPHKAQIQAALRFVQSHLLAPEAIDQGAAWDQTNWALVYAILFVSECQVRSRQRRLQKFLAEHTELLCRRQQASGGFAHGATATVNALGYLELNILGGFALAALGSARQAGCEVDQDIVKGLIAYLEASSGSDGGVGYSTRPGQKGRGNIGRTGIAWLGARALGWQENAFVRRMGEYCEGHVAAAHEGHASLMQHTLVAGLCARVVGAKAQRRFWVQHASDLCLARCPQGSLQPRPWDESLHLQRNSDVSVGEVWTTASWALLLACQEDGKGRGLQALGVGGPR